VAESEGSEESVDVGRLLRVLVSEIRGEVFVVEGSEDLLGNLDLSLDVGSVVLVGSLGFVVGVRSADLLEGTIRGRRRLFDVHGGSIVAFLRVSVGNRIDDGTLGNLSISPVDLQGKGKKKESEEEDFSRRRRRTRLGNEERDSPVRRWSTAGRPWRSA